jgi:predicted nucleic acid-binding protein
MRNLLDTNVWIDALSGKLSAPVFLKIAVQSSWTGYSAITRLELFGFPGLVEEEELKITALLKPFAEVAVDSRIIDQAIGIRKKTRVKVPDAIIAATAMEKESCLITRNIADFKGIAGLVVMDPFSI